ncbi:hypothetical protein ACTXT7_014051 [Hymenolepis weldensis]
MSDQSNRPRPDQRPIIAPQLITVSSNVNASSPTGNVARPMTPLIVRTTGNASAPNMHRNLVLIRPSNVAPIGGNTPRFIVQQNPVQQTRQILPQAVISQPSIASSSSSIISATTSSPSTSAAGSQQVAQPKMTARAALLQNASIPVPVSNKNVPRSFELRYRAIPGPKSRDTSSNVAEAAARLRASSQDDDSETLKGEVVKRMQVRVCPRPNQKFSILRYNSDRIDLYAISSSSGNANERISSSSSGLPEVFIQRENNLRQYKASHNIQDGPNKGAGSEFGQDAKEEARMRRLGISRQGYSPEDQPWLLTVGKGRTAKRYRGVKEGSVSANVGHFIFCQNGDGSFNAYPVDEWYKLSSEITYRFLRDEEAEEEFKNRYNTLNMFNVMVKRRLNPDEEDEDGNPRGKDGEDETAGTSSKSRLSKKKRTKSTKLPPKSSNFLLTELDEWKVFANDEDDEEDLENTLENTNGDEEGGDEKKKTTTAGNGEPLLSVKKRKELENRKKRAATIVARKRRATKQRARRRRKGVVQHSSDEEDDPFEEAVDESDPDDHEGDEVDYMTDSSSDEEKLSEEEREQIYEEQGVDEEAGLKVLLTDISDSEEEGNKDHEKKEQEELIQSNDEESNGESDIEDLDNEGQHHKGHRSGGDSKNRSFSDEGSASDSSSDSSSSSVSDSDIAPDDPSHLARKAQKKTELLQRISEKVAAQAAEEHSTSKRPFQDDSSSSPQAKRFKPTAAITLISSSSQAASATVNTPADDAFVAAVRKYLMRKPISLPDLLKKMKSKRLLPQSSWSLQGRVGTDDVAETMLANALRQLRPMKQIINGQSYLSLKR